MARKRNAGWAETAEAASKRILPLPMYPELTDEQVEYVVGVVKEYFGSAPGARQP